jgi:hypothetical protein
MDRKRFAWIVNDLRRAMASWVGEPWVTKRTSSVEMAHSVRSTLTGNADTISSKKPARNPSFCPQQAFWLVRGAVDRPVVFLGDAVDSATVNAHACLTSDRQALERVARVALTVFE